MNPLQQMARKAALSNTLRLIDSPEQAAKMLEQIRSLPDDVLNAMAAADGIPEEQRPIYRAHMRGQPNPFLDDIAAVGDVMKPGDVILVTGTAKSSKALAASQKGLYVYARSSHVALVHSDFICIDAMPGVGVSNRLIHEVLTDVEDDWRVIRFKGTEDKHADVIRRACSFYLAQPYKIKASRRPGKDFAYCSELARKVYVDSGLTKTGINKSHIVGPAHFDQLADLHPQWKDVTADVRPYVEMCRKYAAMLRLAARLFIEGLQLNRARFEDRRNALKQAQLDVAKKLITKEQYLEMVKTFKQIEDSLHHQFWDTGKPLGAAMPPAPAPAPAPGPRANENERRAP